MTMTKDDEEKMIYEQIIAQREEIMRFKAEKKIIDARIDLANKGLEALKQAALDYMNGNGIISTDLFYIKNTEAVDVDDVEAVPDEYVRIKEVRTANKDKIKSDQPQANWYKINKNQTVVLKEMK